MAGWEVAPFTCNEEVQQKDAMPSRIPTWLLYGVEIVRESWPLQCRPSPSNAGEAGTCGTNRLEGVSGEDVKEWSQILQPFELTLEDRQRDLFNVGSHDHSS